MTDLPVADPSAACAPVIAAELRVDLEMARAWLSFHYPWLAVAINRFAGELVALDDDALLDAWRRFINDNAVYSWLLALAGSAETAQEPAGDELPQVAGVTYTMRPR